MPCVLCLCVQCVCFPCVASILDQSGVQPDHCSSTFLQLIMGVTRTISWSVLFSSWPLVPYRKLIVDYRMRTQTGNRHTRPSNTCLSAWFSAVVTRIWEWAEVWRCYGTGHVAHQRALNVWSKQFWLSLLSPSSDLSSEHRGRLNQLWQIHLEMCSWCSVVKQQPPTSSDFESWARQNTLQDLHHLISNGITQQNAAGSFVKARHKDEG